VVVSYLTPAPSAKQQAETFGLFDRVFKS